MKRMNLLFIGGRNSGKSTLILRMVHEIQTNIPKWLNLTVSLSDTAAPNVFRTNLDSYMNKIPPVPMHEPTENRVCTLHVRKKQVFWFSVLMDVLRRTFFCGSKGELRGIQLNIYEFSIENPHLGEWLLNHPDSKTPLGVVFIADPFAVGKTCESHREPAIEAVAQKLVQRFDQIYVGNPEKRLPVPVALVVTHSENFTQFQKDARSLMSADSMREMHRAAGDMDGMIPDSTLLNHLLKQQSSEAQALMEHYDGNFVHLLENTFQNVRYFWSGISNFQPEYGTGFLSLASPLLPILWLLSDSFEY